jgi:asparagine synthase (glutamine-hydrolysing)
MTREHVTVSLSGDGGDELFNGYDRYPVFKGSWDRIRKYPYPVRSILGDLLANNTYDPSSDKYVRGRMLKAKGAGDLYNISRELDGGALNIVADDKRALNNNDTLDPRFLKNSYRQLMLMDMMMYLPDDILVKVDRCSMAVSLESRVPMLDRDVVEFALSLTMDYLYDENTKTGKKLLREVLYRYVPRELTDRPKKGFSIPISKWLREDEALNKWAVELLDPEVIAKQGFLNAQTVSRLWDDLIKNNVWKVQIWYILMFQSWLRQNGY